MLNQGIDFISVLHIELLRGLVAIHSLAVVQETNSVNRESLALAVGIHQLARYKNSMGVNSRTFLSGVVNFNLNRTSLPSAFLTFNWIELAPAPPRIE